MKKIERIVPIATDTFTDIRHRAEERNPELIAVSYFIEGPVVAVNLVSTNECPPGWTWGEVKPPYHAYDPSESPTLADFKLITVPFENDGSQDHRALINRDFGYTKDFGMGRIC